MDPAPRSPIRTYRDLKAWQKGVELAKVTYRLTGAFPAEERYGLTSQMRRAAVSVPANIAEGYGRGRRAEYIRFLEIARGSLCELQTHAELAREFGWFGPEAVREFGRLSEEVDRILSGLIRALRRPKR